MTGSSARIDWTAIETRLGRQVGLEERIRGEVSDLAHWTAELLTRADQTVRWCESKREEIAAACEEGLTHQEYLDKSSGRFEDDA